MGNCLLLFRDQTTEILGCSWPLLSNQCAGGLGRMELTRRVSQLHLSRRFWFRPRRLDLMPRISIMINLVRGQ